MKSKTSALPTTLAILAILFLALNSVGVRISDSGEYEFKLLSPFSSSEKPECPENTQLQFDYQIWAYSENGEVRFKLMPLYNSICGNLPEMQFHLHDQDGNEFGTIPYTRMTLTETTIPIPEDRDLSLTAVSISMGNHIQVCHLNESRQEDIAHTADGAYTKFYGTCTLTKLNIGK